jgi:hypothetical protein
MKKVRLHQPFFVRREGTGITSAHPDVDALRGVVTEASLIAKIPAFHRLA